MDAWEQIRKLIDDAMEKKDRTINLCVTPDGGVTINVWPVWPSYGGKEGDEE